MFCPKCGSELPDGSTFCPKCGPTSDQPATNTTATPTTFAPNPTIDSATSAVAGAVSAMGNPKTKRFLILGGVVAVAAIAAIVVLLNVTGFFTKGQSADTFKTQLEQSYIMESGVASPMYLNESEYTLTDYSCSDIKVTKDPTLGIDMVTADIDATIENDNYTTQAKLVGTYYDMKGTAAEQYLGASSNYSFNVVSSTTTPKKGIDFDKNLKLENCESVLSDDKMSCTVKQEKKTSFWFADSSMNSDYTFTFNGTSWVEPKETDPVHTVVYKNLDGNYAAKTGDLTNFSKFTVSNVDAAKGTFTIDYTYAAPKNMWNDGIEVTGTLTATIEPKASSLKTYTMDDGYAYYFEAKGTSSSGDGQASMKGYLKNSDSGDDTIQIDNLSIDYTSTGKYTLKYSGYGPVFKQK